MGKTSVYLCERSLEAALHNCAVTSELAGAIWYGKAPSGMALVRPPGHHAFSQSFGSYCLLNTVAITARWLLERPGGPQKILIVDWDVHHGDGTQSLVEADDLLQKACLFVSVHRHDRDFWPTSGAVGEGARNTVVNVPLCGRGFGDADYFAVFADIVLPLAKSFRPDIVLVSAGYDCARGDLLGCFDVSSNGFFMMTRLLLDARGTGLGVPALFVLEGGYDVAEDPEDPHGPLCTGVQATVQGLLAGPVTVSELPAGWRDAARAETSEVIAQVLGRVG